MAKRKPKPQPQPTCSCLLLCDDVVISHAQEKHALHGVIGAMAVPKLPAVLGGFVVYIRLSNVHATQTVNVMFKPAKDEPDAKGLWELVAQVIQRDPLEVSTLIARVPPFQVTEAGRYIVTAEHGGVPLASIPVTIHNLDMERESNP